ncbi:MAG TPA: alpha/beta hydrolase [Thermoplasmata archaeon]|nr:alpha/beta hydrolase [Thermoplasmata archaeon]
MLRRSTPRFQNPDGSTVPGSIASLQAAEIGGVRQWVLVRGQDSTRPLLLFLHGGPGEGAILYARQVQEELERAFLVANWDQRGAGLSYDPQIPLESMTVDRLVADTIEVSRMLLEQYGRRKLLLVGHSWGTILGILAAQRAPELYLAYVGAGQVVDAEESERRMYAWAVAEARGRAMERAVRELEAIGAPPYASVRGFRLARRWVARLGGVARPGVERSMAWRSIAHLREYTLGDLVRWSRGVSFSARTLVPEAGSTDLPRRVTALKIPTYFLSGRSDRVCDPWLAREYLRVLDAPRKAWAWVDDAAHLVPFEEPAEFAGAMAHFEVEARLPDAPAWSVAG